MFGLSGAAHLLGLSWNDPPSVEADCWSLSVQCEPTAERGNIWHFAFSYSDGSQSGVFENKQHSRCPLFRVSAVTSLPITMATQHSLHYCNSCRVCLCTRESVCLDSLRPMNWSQCDRTLCSSESWSSGD